MQPALPTGTQGEEGYQEHGIGVPPPLVGRPGASGELGSTHNLSDRHSTTRRQIASADGWKYSLDEVRKEQQKGPRIRRVVNIRSNVIGHQRIQINLYANSKNGLRQHRVEN